MAEVGERFDSLYPNRQTPPSLKQIGGTNTLDKWDEVNSVALSGTTLGAATAMYIGGNTVPRMYTQTVDFVLGVPQTITHNLNNANPVVMVYGSGNYAGLLPMGSGVEAGTTSYISYVAYSGTANTIILATISGIAGAKVVLLG